MVVSLVAYFFLAHPVSETKVMMTTTTLTQKRVHCSLSSNHQNTSKTRMGTRRHGQGRGAGNVEKCFLCCKCCLMSQ